MDSFDASDEPAARVRFLYEPSSGSVEYATEDAREWLDPERRRLVGRLLDDLDLDASDRACLRHDGLRFEFDAMFGALGSRLLITVSTCSADGPPPADLLTDRQLEVAECAASGATGPEIAETLGVKPSTVYDHLQKIYDRLQIGSRAELTRAIVGD